VSWSVIIRPLAEADIEEARQWYEQQRPSLGSEFLDEISRAFGVLEEHPERRPIYYLGFRRILTRRFPYKVFYRVEGARVIVFRVLHAKRDHRPWLTR
jgi:plasmid stabilization system protein ParE